jgi:hypothetical protein
MAQYELKLMQEQLQQMYKFHESFCDLSLCMS